MTAVFQHAFYIGNYLNAILYGIELMLFFATIRTMLQQPRHRRCRLDVFFIVFSSTLLCLNTVFVATEAFFGEEMWIVNKDYPGGQDAYLQDYASVWYQTWGTAASIVLNLLSDALLIHRCYTIWGDVRIVFLPCIIYAGTFSAGIAQLVVSSRPHANYFAGLAKKLGICYTTLVISLETIVTALICARIVYIAYRYESAVGRLARPYTGAVAIAVESALPCTLLGLVYLVTFALEEDVSVLFLSVYVMFTCISPQMIIRRVMSGRGWTSDTTHSIMTGAPLEVGSYGVRLSTGFSIDVESVISQMKVQERTQGVQ